MYEECACSLWGELPISGREGGGGDSQTAVTKVLIRIWLKGGERRAENIARRAAPLWTGAWRKSSLLSEVKLKRHREQML